MRNYYSAGYNDDCFKHLDYSKATPERKYIKILKYVYDNPRSKRVDIVTAVFADSPVVKNAWLTEKPATQLRGYAVTYFGQLVNDDLLFRDGEGSNLRFSITEPGIDLLKKCGAI